MHFNDEFSKYLTPLVRDILSMNRACYNSLRKAYVCDRKNYLDFGLLGFTYAKIVYLIFSVYS